MKYYKTIIVTLNIPFFTFGAAIEDLYTQIKPHHFGFHAVPFGVSWKQNSKQADIRKFLKPAEPQSPVPVLPTEASIREQMKIAQAGGRYVIPMASMGPTASVVAGSKRKKRETDSDDENRSTVETSEDQSCNEKGSSRASSPLSMGADSVEASAGKGSQSDAMMDSEEDSPDGDLGTYPEGDVHQMGLEYAAAEESIRLQLAALTPYPTVESLEAIDKMILAYQCVEAIPSIILDKYYPGGMNLYAKVRLRHRDIVLNFSATEYPGRTLLNTLEKASRPSQHSINKSDNLLDLSPDAFVDPAILALKEALERWLAEEDVLSAPGSPAR